MTGRKFLFSKPFLLLLAVGVAVTAYFFFLELQRRWKVEKEILAINQQISDSQENNQQLSDLISYLRSSSFQEKEIRRKLNLQKPGEHAVALPQATASGTADLQDETQEPETWNWKLWWNYLFGGQS